ncbi:MAG: DeoR/GlpR family DNA-binding transcription regulator [Spirochaetia bacterium]|jgi:DeoR family fructose operon transcriptional repressor
MLKPERELKIISKLRSEGVVRLPELSTLIGTSENTIRRDLTRLESMGILRRTHGGAILNDFDDQRSSEDTEWIARQKKFPLEKERIGRKAAELVHDGDAIVLDAGTTTMQIARNLHAKRNITVVTNAVNIGLEIVRSDSITVLLTGGILRDISKSLVGPLNEEFLSGNMHVDWMFLSAGGVSIDGGITNANTVEIPIKKAMIRASREVVLTVTHDKIGKRSFAPIASLDAISTIITDADADRELLKPLEDRGIKIILV